MLFQLEEIHGQCFPSAKNFTFSLEKGKPGHWNVSAEQYKCYVLVPANKMLLMETIFITFSEEKSCPVFYQLHTSLISISKIYDTFFSFISQSHQ